MKKLNYILLIFIIILSFAQDKQCFAQGYAENSIIDSLHNELEKSNLHDTTYINLLTEIGEQTPIFRISYWDTIAIVSKKALEKNSSLQVKNRLSTSLAEALNNIGFIHQFQGDIPSAIEYLEKSLALKKKINDKKGMATSYNNLGVILLQQGNIPLAIEYYEKSLQLREEFGDKHGIANSYNNIGQIHDNQGDIKLALEYYEKSLQLREEIGDKNGMAYSYNNIGVIYKNQGDIPLTLKYYEKSLQLREEIGDKKGMADSYNNIGSIYNQQGDILLALEYHEKSLQLHKEIGDKEGMANSYNNIGQIELEKNGKEGLVSAKSYFQKSLELAQELGYPELISHSSENLSKVYRKQGKGMLALDMHLLHISMKDSINNEAAQKASAQQQAKYEYEKQKAVDDAEHDKLLAIGQEEKEKQQILTTATASGLGLVVVFLLFVFNRLRVTKKQKLVIEEQKEVVELAHSELEKKNTEILDSIVYAKRIQSAILPPSKVVKEYLQRSFILYKPKDIVAGDFYWMETSAPLSHQNTILFAAADCTGHGVPGAMVSVVCNNGLNRSVREHGLTDPAEILNKTREIVIQEFEKSEEEVTDGMDIALCSLANNGDSYQLKYAGANNPLWIIRNGEILETKANKQPIGKFRMAEPFTSHSFELQKEDSIYLFSDGFVDQFGGEKGKKFKAKAFRKLLLSVQDQPMEKQLVLLDEAFEAWRGDLEQVDDVCVIGVRI